MTRTIRSGNRPVFNPGRLYGLELWFEADRITGLNDADAVGTWPDLSGKGRDATQGTAANKPLYKVNIINGRPVVRFDGTNDVMSSAVFSGIGQPITIVAVAKFVSTPLITTTKVLFRDTTTNNGRGGLNNPTGTVRYFEFAGSSITVGTPDTNFHVLSYVLNNTSAVIRVDGTQVGSGTVGAGGNFTQLVLCDTADIDLAAMVMYSRDMNASIGDLQKLERFWGSKYAITVA